MPWVLLVVLLLAAAALKNPASMVTLLTLTLWAAASASILEDILGEVMGLGDNLGEKALLAAVCTSERDSRATVPARLWAAAAAADFEAAVASPAAAAASAGASPSVAASAEVPAAAFAGVSVFVPSAACEVGVWGTWW